MAVGISLWASRHLNRLPLMTTRTGPLHVLSRLLRFCLFAGCVAAVVVASLSMIAPLNASGSTRTTASPVSSESAAAFLAQTVRELFEGQYDRAWEGLYPDQQRIAPLDRYVACTEQGAALIGELKSITLIDSYRAPAQRIPGTTKVASSTAVTFRIRSTVLGHLRSETDTFHAYRLNGHWRWTLEQASVAAYRAHHCP